MKMSERDRRDWSLLIFILPFGILLMLITGQFAMRIIPQWILNVGMGSELKVETAGGRQTVLNPFFNIGILTPFSWQNTYLTPNADSGFVFPPFVVLEPSATPSQTPIAITAPPTEVPPTQTTTPATPSPVVVLTTPPPATSTEVTPQPPATCQNPLATNYGEPLPCIDPPPATCQDPLATNYGRPLPCIDPPPATCQDTLATNYGEQLPCDYSIVSTPDPSYTQVSPPPANLGLGTPPDSSVGEIQDGQYLVLGLSIVVGPTPDNNYDLVFYEYNNGGVVYMDWIIIGISNYADGSQYYEVFNWGSGTSPDANSNIGDIAGTEDDDQTIALSELHDPDGSGGSAPQTGILVDVDHAVSSPPPDTYNYVVIISPTGGVTGTNAQIDSIQAVEVPTP